jgi:hypothetical protein
MKEKTIVSSMTLIGSLTAYFYARHYVKDAMPYVMVGGFIGAMLGEAVAEMVKKDNEK